MNASNDKPLTPAEIKEFKENQKILGAAYAKDPKGTVDALREAWKDMKDFPGQSGQLNG